MRANDLILGVQEKAKCIMHKYARKAADPRPQSRRGPFLRGVNAAAGTG